jgi:hypothetical protein
MRTVPGTHHSVRQQRPVDLPGLPRQGPGAHLAPRRRHRETLPTSLDGRRAAPPAGAAQRLASSCFLSGPDRCLDSGLHRCTEGCTESCSTPLRDPGIRPAHPPRASPPPLPTPLSPRKSEEEDVVQHRPAQPRAQPIPASSGRPAGTRSARAAPAPVADPPRWAADGCADSRAWRRASR